MKIFKYKLDLIDWQSLSLPKNAQLLHIAEQRGEVFVWVLADYSLHYENRNIVCFGTGHEIPENNRRMFIGTVLLHGGDLVLHFFEETL